MYQNNFGGGGFTSKIFKMRVYLCVVFLIAIPLVQSVTLETTTDITVSNNETENHTHRTPMPVSKLGFNGFLHAFIASFSVIVVSEVGDKTFFIAAIMAMRHSRFSVFTGAITALTLMTVLSALFGYATTIIPKAITYYIATALFAIFGLKMLYDAYHMKPDEGAQELEQVQAALGPPDDKLNNVENPSPVSVETPGSPSVSVAPENKKKLARRILHIFLSPIFLQAFTMTFVAELGDRSQIATIILAATENIPGVILGGVVGHSGCTGVAVIGGRLVAQKISVRTVTIIGGVVFLIFAITSLFLKPE